MTKKEHMQLVVDFATQLRAAGVTEFDGLGFVMRLSAPEIVHARFGATPEPQNGGLDDPDLYPGGFIPQLRSKEREQ